MATLIPLAPTGSDGGAFDAAAGDSLTLPGLSACDFAPDMAWVRVRLEDANYAFTKGCYEEMRDALAVADGMMRYLELRQREEAAS